MLDDFDVVRVHNSFLDISGIDTNKELRKVHNYQKSDKIRVDNFWIDLSIKSNMNRYIKREDNWVYQQEHVPSELKVRVGLYDWKFIHDKLKMFQWELHEGGLNELLLFDFVPLNALFDFLKAIFLWIFDKKQRSKLVGEIFLVLNFGFDFNNVLIFVYFFF